MARRCACSYQKKGAKAPIHMVSAFAARQRLLKRKVAAWDDDFLASLIAA
jgi:hypothetical protein